MYMCVYIYIYIYIYIYTCKGCRRVGDGGLCRRLAARGGRGCEEGHYHY